VTNSISTRFSVELTHPHKFGVSRPGETVPVCVVSWTETGGRHEFQFCADATAFEIRDQIAAIVRGAIKDLQDLRTKTKGGALQWKRVREALLEAGFAVLDMGGSEAQFEFNIDLESGRIVGRSPMSNPPVGDLGESMAAAVRRGFDTGIEALATCVEKAVEAGTRTLRVHSSMAHRQYCSSPTDMPHCFASPRDK
jgi:hypothetical protein